MTHRLNNQLKMTTISLITFIDLLISFEYFTENSLISYGAGRRCSSPAPHPPEPPALKLWLRVRSCRRGAAMFQKSGCLSSLLPFILLPPSFPFPWAHRLKSPRGLGIAEPGRQTVSMHSGVKIGLKVNEQFKNNLNADVARISKSNKMT